MSSWNPRTWLRKFLVLVAFFAVVGLTAIAETATDVTIFEGLDIYGLPVGVLLSAGLVFITKESSARLEAYRQAQSKEKS